MSEHNEPVFVKIEEYKDVLEIVKVLRDKLTKAKKLLGELNKLKNDEDSELELWENNLDDISLKLKGVDEMLYEPKF
ncbi:hypothetical protein GOV05_01965 [Candidatus Woesearchaeota archaeon]|nr:hypothetical protein [Candidatus Woesearchaeota archaeon]